MEPNITNTGDTPIRFPWGGFVYELAPGESKNVIKIAADAIMKRFPAVKPYKQAPKREYFKKKEVVEDAVS